MVGQGYVAGFLFHNMKEPINGEVLLVHKLKGPSFNVDKLNGIGGKIEPGEMAQQAMQREFAEETGVDVSADDWVKFLELEVGGIGPSARVHFYKHVVSHIVHHQTTEVEPIWSVPLQMISHDLTQGSEGLRYGRLVFAPNLPWILSLALSETAQNVRAEEHHSIPFEVL